MSMMLSLLITVAILLALVAAVYSFYLHNKISGLQQIIEDLKRFIKINGSKP